MRYIDFTLEGAHSDIAVHMEEQPDGTILVTLDTGEPVDIRGLFFDVNDSSLIDSLSVSGDAVTGSQFGDEAVMDLGRGVNMHGEGGGRSPFDVGVSFGTPGQGHDVVSSTSFVLSSSEGPLTLDALALVDFGVRIQGDGPPRIVEIAPAAPDAIDDLLAATEDQTIVYDVLGNDTDADGTGDFTIVSVTDPEHGTATISEDGLTIIYTPDLNYSGPDSFHYAMSDGHGGGDDADATIGVIAVADAPTLDVSTAAGDTVNEILVTVTSQVTDTDGSEYIDRFAFSGLPAGAEIVGESDLVYDPSSTGGSLTQTFTLQLAPGTDFDFDLGVSAVSREVSNGSEATTSENVAVLVDSNSNDFALDFLATDQSIWGAGDAFMIEDSRFIGFEVDPGRSESGDFIYGYGDIYLRAGFQSDLTFDGGSIDASAPWDISIDTTYNHTTDVILIESMTDLLSGGVSFTTSGPAGSYLLDFIFNYAISVGAGIDYGVDSEDFFNINSSSNTTINILDVDSEDLGITFEFPYGLSITLEWPDIDTSSLVGTGTDFESAGASNNFFELGVDLDDALTQILGIPNPFSASFDIGIAWGTADLLDVDLMAGMNFVQDFMMALGGLDATLLFEDGTSMGWDFSDLVISGASSYDADNDGSIEFGLQLDQQATLQNDTDLGFNMGYHVAVLQVSGGYDVLVYQDDFSLGPVWQTGETVPLGTIDLFDSTFDLDFASQTISFVGNEHMVA